MKLVSSSFGVLSVVIGVAAAAPTWPSSIDELEDVMFLNTGYKSRGFSSHVTPCGFSEFGVGRQTAAEWLRIGFHDMSTANVFNPPHGGIDGSLAFELNSGENIGAGFNTTFTTYGNLYNSQLSVADLVALGVYTSVRACGGPVIPMRGGRVDATAAGPIGVPQPQNGRGTFSNQFARMGFNTAEMIQMTACGHTLGGVHAGNFPNIVAPGSAPDDFQLFDNSLVFDNAIATRYVSGPNTDPLSGALAASSGRDADNAVFGADNVTINAMTTAATFNTMCSNILQKMIEVVDPAIVTLSPIIAPYDVKPSGLQLELSASGTTLTFSGDIRVRTTTRSTSQISSVTVIYLDRTGATGGIISTSLSGTASGFDDSFTFYGFSQSIPATTSIGSFTVVITLNQAAGGSTTDYNNNGAGFLVQDSVIVQMPQSCYQNGNLTVVAAVRNTVATAVNLRVTTKVARANVPVPALSNTIVTLAKGATVGPYALYSGSSTIASAAGTKFGVASGAFSDIFKDASDLGTSCLAVGATPTGPSVTPTPTLAHKQKVGLYTFQGCYTEGTGVRALNGPSFFNYTAMTMEMCASNCAGTTYFGVEYGGECYCGNTLDVTSTLATLSDCSFICPGDQYEYCGAGNRMEMYKLGGSSVTTTSSSSSTSGSASSTFVSSTKSSSSGTTTMSSTSLSASVSSSSLPLTSTSTSGSVSSTQSSSSSPTLTSTSSSAAPTGTLGIHPTVGAYTYQGCYTEGTGVRALSPGAFYDYVSMTLESCAASCSAYTYFGVEYGGECYCGDSIDVTSTLVLAAYCSFICPGNASEYCGAGNHLSLFKKGAVVSSSVSSSSLSSTLSSSLSSTSSSTLSSTLSTTSPVVLSSTSTSKSSTLSTSTTKTSSSSTSSSTSSTKTSSKSTTKTSSSSKSSSSSTKTSSTSTRPTTSSSSTKSSSTSTSKPLSTSTRSSSTSTANTLSTSTKSSSTSTANPLSTSSSTTQSSSISSTQTSTSSSAAASQTALGIKPTVGAYTYYGCQTEGTGVRALSGKSAFDYPTMTLEECATNCAGYTYFGVEYGGECYCGNTWNTGSIPAPDGECSFTCPGNAFEYCGAGNRLTGYTL